MVKTSKWKQRIARCYENVVKVSNTTHIGLRREKEDDCLPKKLILLMQFLDWNNRHLKLCREMTWRTKILWSKSYLTAKLSRFSSLISTWCCNARWCMKMWWMWWLNQGRIRGNLMADKLERSLMQLVIMTRRNLKGKQSKFSGRMNANNS